MRNTESDYVDDLDECDDDMAQLVDIDMSEMNDETPVFKMMGYVPKLGGDDSVSTIASAFKLAKSKRSGTSVGTASANASVSTQNTSNTTATTASTKKRMTAINDDLAGLLLGLSNGNVTDIDQIRQQLEFLQTKTKSGPTEKLAGDP